MQLPGRHSTASEYRYGFNGMEGDDEVKGGKNSYDFGARMYDPRVGRWLSLDPQMNRYPSKSPYHFSNNNPIIYNDPSGESGELRITRDANGKPIKAQIVASIHFYSGDIGLKNFNHNEVIEGMMEQFNSQNLEIEIDGTKVPVTDNFSKLK